MHTHGFSPVGSGHLALKPTRIQVEGSEHQENPQVRVQVIRGVDLWHGPSEGYGT